MNADDARFPFDLCCDSALDDVALAARIRELEPISLYPPYPWGQWLYGRIFQRHCASLPGDVMECGVARGGMSIFLGQLCREAGKRVLALDTYAGLPEPSEQLDNPYFKAGDYAPATSSPGTLDRLCANLERYDLTDTVVPIPGLFGDTLPELPDHTQLCFLHIDADLYESVDDVLEGAYDRVVDGGVIVLDDFFHHAQGPARAASAFFNRRGIFPLYHVSFPYSVFLFKGHGAHTRDRHRSLDGNFYSLDFLRSDPSFRAAVDRSCDRLAREGGDARNLENARMLRDLLAAPGSRSSDIYTYWRALEDYWDNMCPIATLSDWRDRRATIRL